MTRRFHDDGDEVAVAAFGPRIQHALRAWALRYRGPCDHPDREQWSTVRDLTSVCLPCASAGALRQWEDRGPCDTCGRYLPVPPGRIWTMPSVQTMGVQLVLKVCDQCSDDQLSEPDEEENER